ncbi:MAG: histidine phosphatase family protein [Actinomycetes bacterium]
MSDLQCAATLLLVGHGDEGQSREVGRSLGDRRVSMVYTSPAPDAVQTAKIAAAELGVQVRVAEQLDEASTMAAALDSAADLHRGETVLFVTARDAIRAAISPLVPNGVPGDRPLGSCDVVEVAVDADGWVLRSWAGQPVG